MASQQSPSRMMILLPMLFFMGKVDFGNPLILNSCRIAFFTCQIVSLCLAYYLKKKILTLNDQRIIHVPAAKSPWDQNANNISYTTTTYIKYELAKVKEFMQQSLIGACISTFIHFKFGVNQVVLIQSIMIPLNLYDNVLVRSYILNKNNGPNDRKWGEKLDGENDKNTMEHKIENHNSISTKNNKPNEKKTKNEIINDAIHEAWDASESYDFIEKLYPLIKDFPNTATVQDGWTSLMVASGSSGQSIDFIETLLKNPNLDKLKRDNDGWTAVHWATFHGRPECLKLLLKSMKKDEIKRVFDMEDNDKRNLVDLAKESEISDITDIINEFQNIESKNEEVCLDKDSDNGLRSRAKKESTIQQVD